VGGGLKDSHRKECFIRWVICGGAVRGSWGGGGATCLIPMYLE